MSSKNPNHADKAKSDAKSPIGACPHMKNKVQLLPLRYGLVERLDPSAELSLPYSLESRPLGIRLIRDGWLYVIVSKQPKAILHEYRIAKGVITQLLWNKAEVIADKRETSVGAAQLIFSRNDPLHVAYSEVQWTAAKCAQVLNSPKERRYFMQAVDLSRVDCEKGAADLLTTHQVNKWLAEVAEKPATTSAGQGVHPEEVKDYAWEQPSLYQQTQLGMLKKSLNPQYENDHLYLVVRDDIGVLRDLASHQDLAAGWIIDWSSAETTQKKYVIGCYIESLYRLNEQQMLSAAKQDPRFAKLEEETDLTQRQSISDYINIKHQTQWHGPGTHRGAINASRMRMRQSLGAPLYAKYEDFIESLDENAEDALEGAKWGQRGIGDLTDRPGMEAFLKQQRAQLKRWNERLDLITEDRIAMVAAERFHRAAWYFDPQSSTQIEVALATEYACLKDICRTDKATDAVAALLDKYPQLSLPGFFTLSHSDQIDMQTKLSSLIKGMRDTAMASNDYSGAHELSVQFKGLVQQQLPSVFHLSETGITLNQLRNTAYEPAKQLGLAAAMDGAMQGLRNAAPLDPGKVLRALPGAAWLDVLRAFGQGGITLEFAAASQIHAFEADTRELAELRSTLTALKHKIRQTLAFERRGRLPHGSHRSLLAERKALQANLLPLESRVASALSPVGEGPSKAGVKIKGLNSTQVAEFQHMAEDFRLKRPFKGLGEGVFRSVGADMFASVVAVWQIRNFVVVSAEFQRKADSNWADRVALANAFFSMMAGVAAAAQGIAVTSLSVAINNYASVAGKITTAARLGKLTASFGLPAYAFSLLAASTSLKGSIDKFNEGLRRGDAGMLAGAGITGVGDAGQVGINSWALVRSSGIVIGVLKDTQQARAAAWAVAGGRLVSIAARANLIGLALTGLQLGGEWIYNRNNLSKLDDWLQQGPWGLRDAQRPLATEHLRLATITAAPRAALQPDKTAGLFILQVPGVIAAELDDSSISLAAYWLSNQQRNDWQPWTEPLLYQFKLLSKLHEPLLLGLEIYPQEANAQHGLAIELRYPPLAGSNEVHIKRFESLTLLAQQGKPMAEVALLRVRNANAPSLPLTLDTLDQPATS
ncbi:hypothetical protein CH92_19270 [Stutzerimonas stutzeri]|uniref:Toxin VasX N-terminal region domain-containing protein n=1 Tax=Stutzerimonas stutzeri TaxID=316 RepID=W8R3E4_STUST|nr:toxin VasX [Stutzerimonas stutzeri]AHL77104.1 hypothetical protein CH92_19270 [Stutzerimonas stutzeri]MCQ4329985.1 hypothetical protein [Stutzerimonas stutzeri]